MPLEWLDDDLFVDAAPIPATPAPAPDFDSGLFRSSDYRVDWQPEPPPRPADVPDWVRVHRTTYMDRGMYGGRTDPMNRDFIRVIRSDAERFGLPSNEVFELDAPLPPRRVCVCCGRHRAPSEPGDGACAICLPRIEATQTAIANGGRRFGIELEFSMPSGSGAFDEYDEPDMRFDSGPGYDPDAECNCYSCRCSRLTAGARRERNQMIIGGPEDVAEAIRLAGVDCNSPGYTHSIEPGVWKIVPDGSLSDGYELVSPPLQWAQADQVRTVCRVLQEIGCEPTSDCGLHVHHDVGDLTVARARTLAHNWNVCTPHTNRLVDSSRVYSDWCYPADEDTVRLQCNYAGDSLHSFLGQDCERYRALNWTCWHSYGTVEVRMHESTFDADEILAWIAYGQSIIDASMEERELEDPSTLDDVLNQVTIRRAARPHRTRELLRAKAARSSEPIPRRRRRDYW